MSVAKLRHCLLAVGLLLPLLLLPGCWNPFNPPLAPFGEGSALGPQEQLLQDLLNAYNHMDIESYMVCLSDTFVFQFALVDSAELKSRGITQPYWGRTDEEIATRNIFDNATSLDLVFFAGDWTPSTQDPTGSLLQTRRSYHLYFYGLIPDEGVEGEMEASGYATFLVREEGGRWKIVRWTDENLSG